MEYLINVLKFGEKMINCIVKIKVLTYCKSHDSKRKEIENKSNKHLMKNINFLSKLVENSSDTTTKLFLYSDITHFPLIGSGHSLNQNLNHCRPPAA